MHDKHLRAHLRDGDHLRAFALREFIAAIRTGRLIAFTGSYATEDMGYPAWTKFLQDYFKLFRTDDDISKEWLQSAYAKIPKTGSPAIAIVDLVVESYFARGGGDRKKGFTDKRKSLIEKKFFGLDRVTDPALLSDSTPYNIVESLGINRIITTNYDLEMEWQVMVTGMEKAAVAAGGLSRSAFFAELIRADKIRRDGKTKGLLRRLPSGRSARSDVFNRERTDRLFEFAVGAPDHDGHVLHLHGRATGEDEEELIVGLGDYERQYRRSGVTKLPFEHTLKLLYSGNPVIFIGSGMQEAEVTGTLENFVSDDPRRRLAPAFVIWSPAPTTTNAADIKLGPDDKLRRIEWYRRFGVLTIYDCELSLEGVADSFDPAKAVAPKGVKALPRRVSYAVRALGAYAEARIAPFTWRREDLRSAQARFKPIELDKFHEKQGRRFDVWRANEIVDPDGDLLEIFSDRYGGPVAADKPLLGRADADLLKTLFCGAPVKAIIDRPGSGHGYLAKVIAKTFAKDLSNEMPHGIGMCTAASLINAGFLCDMDSTFSLISGLFDNVTAFGTDPDPEDGKLAPNAKSRHRAFREYIEKLQKQILRGGALDRHLLLIINGMDRFFETSGYPLSNELDDMMRMITGTYRARLPGKAVGTIHDWVAHHEVVNPFTVILLGTSRVERYLADLGWERERDDGHGNRAPALGHGDYAVLNANDYWPGHKVLEAIEKRNEELRTRLKIKPDFDQSFARPHSNYLKLVRHNMEVGLSAARRTRIERGGQRSIGDLRHNMLAAYLRSSSLSQATPDTADKIKLPDLCLDILSSLAFFGEPIDSCVLGTVPRIGERLKQLHSSIVDNAERTAMDKAAIEGAIKLLRDFNLILRFEPFPDNPEGWDRYGVHRSVLAEMRDRYGVPISEAKLSTGFNLSLFASQLIDDYTPEPDMHRELGELVDAHVAKCLALMAATSNGAAGAEPAAHLRAALAVIRNYFTTSALLMLEPPAPPLDERYSAPLTEQVDRIERLLNAAEQLAGERRKLRNHDEMKGKPIGPEAFYPDDLVWLHNELGVVKLVQGDLYKARFAFDAAEWINQTHVEYKDELQNWRRIQLNQLQLDIERAKINRAESRILELERAVNLHVEQFRREKSDGKAGSSQEAADSSRNVSYPTEQIVAKYGRGPGERIRIVDPDFPADAILIVGLITGYRGLCAYLRGNFKSAEHQFKLAVEILRNIGEHRACAIFLRHSASLQHSMGAHEPARDLRKIGLAAADSVRQMDVAFLYRVDGVSADASDPARAQSAAQLRQIMAALHYAVGSDVYRVRIEARIAFADIRMAAGDYDAALEHAADALAVAARFGFSLRKISLRIMIGRILIRRGDPASGNALLNQAIVNADRVGYQRAVELAQRVRYEDSQLLLSPTIPPPSATPR